jgi:hypothetical protein
MRRSCADDANHANSGNGVEQLYEPRRPDSSRAASIRTDGTPGLIRIGVLYAPDPCQQHPKKGETRMPKNKSYWRARFVVGLLAAALVASVSVPLAHAGPVFQISDGTTTVTVMDNAAGDANPLVGAITYAPGGGGPFPGLSLTISAGVSKPVYPIPNAIDLFSMQITDALPGIKDFTLKFSDTDFTHLLGSANLVLALGGTLTGPGGSIITFDGYEDNTNTLFGTGGAHVGPAAFGPGPYSTQQAVSIIGVSPFSLTEVVTIHFTGPGALSFDSELKVVPEPATLTLLGFGLMGLSACAWRRRKGVGTPTR